MQISHSRVERDLHLWPVINKIQALMRMDNPAFAQFMEMPVKEFLKAKSVAATLPAFAVCILLEKLELDPDLFLSDRLDYHVLSQALRSGQDTLPKRYTDDAFGTLSTPKAFLDSLLASSDPALVTEFFRALQISPRILLNTDQPVNMFFSLDILKFLNKRAKAEKFMFDFGKKGARAARPKVFDLALREAKTIQSVYEIIPYLIETYVEKNFKYSISDLQADTCIFSVVPREHLKELAAKNDDDRRHLSLLCSVRIPYIEEVPVRVGWLPTKLTKLSCFFEGASACRYRVDFMQPSLLQSPLEV